MNASTRCEPGNRTVVELVPEQDSCRLTVAQTGTHVVDLEPENHQWLHIDATARIRNEFDVGL